MRLGRPTQAPWPAPTRPRYAPRPRPRLRTITHPEWRGLGSPGPWVRSGGGGIAADRGDATPIVLQGITSSITSRGHFAASLRDPHQGHFLEPLVR